MNNTIRAMSAVCFFASCAAAGSSVTLRSTMPARAATEAVVNVLSAAVDPAKITGVTVGDDDYLVMTRWHVVGHSAGKVEVARAEIHVAGKDVRVRVERRDCSTHQVSCNLEEPYVREQVRVQTVDYVSSLPAAKDPSIFDQAVLASRIGTAVGAPPPTP